MGILSKTLKPINMEDLIMKKSIYKTLEESV